MESGYLFWIDSAWMIPSLPYSLNVFDGGNVVAVSVVHHFALTAVLCSYLGKPCRIQANICSTSSTLLISFHPYILFRSRSRRMLSGRTLRLVVFNTNVLTIC